MAVNNRNQDISVTETHSSQMSLAETLQQVRATAERLERDIDQSRSYRAQIMN